MIFPYGNAERRRQQNCSQKATNVILNEIYIETTSLYGFTPISHFEKGRESGMREKEGRALY
jgi:hypothetical protein